MFKKNDTVNNLFRLLSGFIGVITFIPLIWSLFNGGSGASFAAFAFWTVIVGITTIVTIKEKGNYMFPLALTIGNLLTTLALLITKQFFWGIVEWMTLILVLVCLYVWIKSSRSFTIIVSTIAISLSGIPQLFLASNQPDNVSIPIWGGFLIASILGLLAGKDWSVKERLYPLARLILYGLVIVIAFFS